MRKGREKGERRRKREGKEERGRRGRRTAAPRTRREERQRHRPTEMTLLDGTSQHWNCCRWVSLCLWIETSATFWLLLQSQSFSLLISWVFPLRGTGPGPLPLTLGSTRLKALTSPWSSRWVKPCCFASGHSQILICLHAVPLGEVVARRRKKVRLLTGLEHSSWISDVCSRPCASTYRQVETSAGRHEADLLPGLPTSIRTLRSHPLCCGPSQGHRLPELRAYAARSPSGHEAGSHGAREPRCTTFGTDHVPVNAHPL